MRYAILFLLVLSSCGAKVNGKVDTSGTITHRVEIAELEVYFRQYCENYAEQNETVDQCTVRLINQFLTSIGQ